MSRYLLGPGSRRVRLLFGQLSRRYQEIPVNGQMVRIFILAILAFALCSCAELFQANPNALPDDYDYFGHTPGAGDPE
jgi:hypothetical protein